MKVLITTEWYDPAINGVVVSVENLRKGLQKLGHEVKILTVSENRNSLWKDDVTYISSLNASKVYPGARIALTALRTNRHIRELIKWAPDIIHSQSEFSTFYMARYIAEQVHSPVVHTYHTVYEDYTHYFIHNKRLGKSLVSKFSKQVLKKTDCVIVPTEKVRSLLEKYGVASTVEVVPTGIDMESFPAALNDDAKKNLRKVLKIPEDSKVLVAVGRLAKEKNLEEIMLFLSRLDRTNLTFLIVGDGPRFESLVEFGRNLGLSESVIFAGMIKHSDIAAYYQAADVFVSASSSETQGLSTIEAVAYGIPALCHKDPSLDNVIKNGVNGWQYESFEDFKEALEGILYQSGKRKITFAPLPPEQSYKNPLDKFAEKVESIYFNTILEFEKKNGKRK
ncbi:MAG: glycosyltransferase family 4 protein [Clostridia bacterium]|nr:glycosyltransferase family 4 protein [Clostridia bacterium]